MRNAAAGAQIRKKQGRRRGERELRAIDSELPELAPSECAAFLADNVGAQVIGGYRKAVLRVKRRPKRLGARQEEPPENSKVRNDSEIHVEGGT